MGYPGQYRKSLDEPAYAGDDHYANSLLQTENERLRAEVNRLESALHTASRGCCARSTVSLPPMRASENQSVKIRRASLHNAQMSRNSSARSDWAGGLEHGQNLPGSRKTWAAVAHGPSHHYPHVRFASESDGNAAERTDALGDHIGANDPKRR